MKCPPKNYSLSSPAAGAGTGWLIKRLPAFTEEALLDRAVPTFL